MAHALFCGSYGSRIKSTSDPVIAPVTFVHDGEVAFQFLVLPINDAVTLYTSPPCPPPPPGGGIGVGVGVGRGIIVPGGGKSTDDPPCPSTVVSATMSTIANIVLGSCDTLSSVGLRF